MLELDERIGITANPHKPLVLVVARCPPIDSGAPSGSFCLQSKHWRNFPDQNSIAGLWLYELHGDSRFHVGTPGVGF